MYDSPAGRAVRASLQSFSTAAQPPNDAQLATVKQHIYAATDELKAGGSSPEHIILRLKELANEVLPATLTGSERQTLMDRFVRWSLERYFSV